LAAYKVLYLSGLNLRRAVVPVLRQWVEEGGTIVAAAGSAMRDEYDSPLPEAADLLGATQQEAGVSNGRWMPFYIVDHEPIDTITIGKSPLTEPLEAGAVGLTTVLTPTTGASIATWAD